MNWEVVNGITGLISAICAVAGIAYLNLTKNIAPQEKKSNTPSRHKLVSFIVACSGWALCCLSYLWVMEPYGTYVSDKEYLQFFGIILALPAVVILIYGMDVMLETKT